MVFLLITGEILLDFAWFGQNDSILAYYKQKGEGIQPLRLCGIYSEMMLFFVFYFITFDAVF
jgi:hypothetical protein